MSPTWVRTTRRLLSATVQSFSRWEQVRRDNSDGLDWAIQHIDDFGADTFVWDSDGVGLGLAREVERQLGHRNVRAVPFHGGERPQEPEAMYDGHRTNRCFL